MALYKFAKAISEDRPIDVFNHGKHRRDFTYVDDIVEGVVRVLDKPALSDPTWNSQNPNSGTSKAPWCLYNIGRNHPVELMDYISALEKALGKKAKINMKPLQLGDVPDTYADVDDLVKNFDYKPKTSIEEGVANFVEWYLKYTRSPK
jgi:UDP-glucuronate 4-epimerase